MVFCYQNCSDLLWEKIVLKSIHFVNSVCMIFIFWKRYPSHQTFPSYPELTSAVILWKPIKESKSATVVSKQLFEYLFRSNKNLFLLWNATSARFLVLLRGGSCIFQDTNFFDWNFPASKSNTLILCTCTFLFLSGPFSSATKVFEISTVDLTGTT